MLKSLQNTFQNSRVLITGHTGFKGSWLSLWLTKLGAQVVGYSLPPPTKPSLFEICAVQDKMVSATGDIRDFETLKNTILKWEPEIVFHMAAQSLVRQSYREPIETYQTNVIGTANILEACRHAPSVRVIINVTSDKCYETQEISRGYCERDPLGGDDPYSSSKACAEIVTHAYIRSFLNPENHDQHRKCVASARAGNVIGGGDWGEDRLVPDCIRAFAAERPALIRNPDSVRPWQHVLEPLYGYMSLAHHLIASHGEISGGWNFGPNDRGLKPVRWLVGKMVEMWGNGASWTMDQGNHPHETFQLRLDSLKAASVIGWSPQWDIESALKRTVEWYKSFYSGKQMMGVTMDHIEAYEKGLRIER
jgi:CDP-glucose 4,6-dehydratase